MLQELDDEDFVTELVSAFLEECNEATDQCLKAKDEKNFDEVRAAAHGLKGSAAIFGAESLSETAKTLEFAIKVDNVTDWDVLSKMIDDLVEHVKSLDHDELKRAAAAMA